MRFYIFLICILLIPALLIAADRPAGLGGAVKSYIFSPEEFDDIMGPRISDYKDSNKRLTLEHTVPSLAGHFLIHYNTTLPEAVSPTDENANNIPDYIDSVSYYLEYAWEIETGEMGFDEPLADQGRGGSDAIDVYIIETGLGYRTFYGATGRDQTPLYTEPVRRYSSYMILDNNYSPDDTTSLTDTTQQTFSTTGMDALKITTAHEFNHVLQMSYGESLSFSRSINEITSTWVESYVFPEIKDYYIYIRQLFSLPQKYYFGSGVPDNGYGHVIFARYLESRFGISVFPRLWELVREGVSPYKAMDSALVESGSSMHDAWLDFMPWIYYTGTRAIEGEYFPDAAELPEIVSYPAGEVVRFSPPSVFRSYRTYAYEFRLLSFLLPTGKAATEDTLHVMITNTDLISAIYQVDGCSDITFTLAQKNTGNMSEVKGTDYYYSFDNDSVKAYLFPFINAGYVAREFEQAYPSPYILSRSSDIYFPAPAGLALETVVELLIFNTDMSLAYRGNYEVSEHEGKAVVTPGQLPEPIGTGVYIYAVKNNENIKYGKLVVTDK